MNYTKNKKMLAIDNFVEESDLTLGIDIIDDPKFKHMLHKEGHGHVRRHNPVDPKSVKLAKKYADKAYQAYLNFCPEDIDKNKKVWIHTMHLLKYTTGGSMLVHTDWINDECSDCILSAVVYFNEDFTGGEIVFPFLNDEAVIVPPKTGSALIYPATETEYSHGVNIVTSGTRYVIGYCFTTNESKAPALYKLY
jgi:hypothetical protein